MKRLIFIIFLLSLWGGTPGAWGQNLPSVTDELQGADQFQAAQWLRLARDFWEVGDYPMLGHFCRLIVDHYPDTYYSAEAEKLLKKSSHPGKNRGREFRRNNPGLFPVD